MLTSSMVNKVKVKGVKAELCSRQWHSRRHNRNDSTAMTLTCTWNDCWGGFSHRQAWRTAIWGLKTPPQSAVALSLLSASWGWSLTGLEVPAKIITKECEKAKTSVPIISSSFKLIWMEFGILLRLVEVMNLILILACVFNIQGREPYLCDFIKKNWTLTCILTCIDHFLSNIISW